MKLLSYQVGHASEDSRPMSSPSSETVSSLLPRVSSWQCEQVAEKGFGVLRPAQHERKMFNHFKLCTVRPEALEGWTVFFFGTCWTTAEAGARRWRREFFLDHCDLA